MAAAPDAAADEEAARSTPATAGRTAPRRRATSSSAAATRPLRVEVVRRLEREAVVADVEGAGHGVLGDRRRLERPSTATETSDGHDDDEHGRRQEPAGPPGVEAGEGQTPVARQLLPEQLR